MALEKWNIRPMNAHQCLYPTLPFWTFHLIGAVQVEAEKGCHQHQNDEWFVKNLLYVP